MKYGKWPLVSFEKLCPESIQAAHTRNIPAESPDIIKKYGEINVLDYGYVNMEVTWGQTDQLSLVRRESRPLSIPDGEESKFTDNTWVSSYFISEFSATFGVIVDVLSTEQTYSTIVKDPVRRAAVFHRAGHFECVSTCPNGAAPDVVRKIEFHHHVRDNELLTSLLDVCDVRPLTFDVGTYLSNINSDMYFSCFDNHCPIHLECINTRIHSVIRDLVAAKYLRDL